MFRLLLVVLLSSVVLASPPDLLGALSSQPSLTQFTAFIKQYPNLLSAAEVGNMTIIAPNDDAFTNFFNTTTSAGNYSSSEGIRALIQYHTLRGAHASASFTSTPTFIQSTLTNPAYTNVTSGQVVEAVTNSSTVNLLSAVHVISKIVVPDVLFLGGFLHIVDVVMVPPVDVASTITQYPLPYFSEALGQILTKNFSAILQNLDVLPNQTYFAANTQAYAESVLNGDLPSNQAGILAEIEYAIIPGQVVYSTAFTDGSKWPTEAGVDLTITELGEDLYVNDAKIVVRDILIANGVLHVLDKGLNVTDAGARPHKRGGSSLSTGAKAGIGVGAAIAVLAVIGIIVFCIRRRKTHKSKETHQTANVFEDDNREIDEEVNRKLAHEMTTESYDKVELDARGKIAELPGDTREYHIDSSPTEGSSSRATDEGQSTDAERSLIREKT